MVKVLLADDHAILRSGLKEILNMVPGIELVGEAANGDEVLSFLKTESLDLLMLDMSMPGLCGLALIERIKSLYPDLFILVLTMLDDIPMVERVLKAGVQGYITKASPPEQLIMAILKVATGGRYIEPILAERMAFSDSNELSLLNKLSNREREIFMLLVQGATPHEIADRLFISIKTVSTHKAHLLEKMNMNNLAELIRYALQHELIE